MKSVIDDIKSKGGVTGQYKNESDNDVNQEDYESEEDDKDRNMVSAMMKVDGTNVRKSGQFSTTSEEVIIIEEDEEEEDSSSIQYNGSQGKVSIHNPQTL